jgi:hypothetical protein
MGVHIVSIQIEDEGGNHKSIVYPVPDSEPLADIQTFITGVMPELDAVLGGKITQASVQMALSLPGGLKAVALADYPVRDGALMGYSVTGSIYRTSHFLPTFLRTLINSADSVDNAGLTLAYNNALIAGEAVLNVSDLHENPLAAFLSGRGRGRKVKI